MVVAHGATGWADEIVELGIPLVVLIALYWWSNRGTKARATSDSLARSELDERSRGGESRTANAGRDEREEENK